MLESVIVSLLSRREASTLDGIVEVQVDEVVERIDAGAQILRIEIESIVRVSAEARVQYADNVGGLVVDDGLPLLVPAHRDGSTSRNGMVRPCFCPACP